MRPSLPAYGFLSAGEYPPTPPQVWKKPGNKSEFKRLAPNKMIDGVHRRYLLGDYCLEPDKQQLSRDGRAIKLPRLPFQVLVYLVEHRTRFVSRTELLDRFWSGKDVYDDALRKCVGAIRRALEDQAEQPVFVETRWGVGYRYIGPLETQLIRDDTAVVEIE